MTDLKKRKKRRKKLLKSRLGSVVAAFLAFFVFSALLCGAFVFMCMMIFDMQIESGLDEELAKASYISKSYSSAADEQSAAALLDNSETAYVLCDKNGSIIRQRGDDTRKGKEVKYLFYSSSGADESGLSDEDLVKRYVLYICDDTESDILEIKDDEDSFELDYLNYAERLLTGMNGYGYNDDSEEGGIKDGYEDNAPPKIDDVELIRSNKAFVQIPVWAKLEIPDKGQTLYLRCLITSNTQDVAYLLGMVVFFGAVLILMFIALIVMVIRSIRNIRKMRSLVFTDIKIGCKNWQWFLFHAERIASKRRYAKQGFALVDLEFVGYRRFCACNSVDEGEVILRSVYDKLRRYVDKKELCAHNAEDSFALMIKYTDDSILKNRVDLILSVLGEVVGSSTLAFHAGIYILPAVENGGVFAKRKNVDIESCFNNACTACATLLENEGSGLAFYNEKLIEEQRWIDTVTKMQQSALDNEEFVVYYQPKYDPRTHELRGAEALIRWQSPQYGFITPYRFIPIFEKNGFITEIDHYMISHVARDQKRWLDEGQRCVPVSVNVSRAHFIESDLAEQIRDMVDKEGTPHQYIEIELTESAFFDDKKAMINTIMKLKGYGFAVSMDDFGSGYSSLNSLKDMPLDVLKLDAEFFRGEAADTERGEAVVSEAIKLAKSLNMRTVAEGVEVKEQVEFLASQGCDMIQGYYFAKPMPGDEYRERMIQGKNDGAEG
ncbi:MAG: EAL domain-containing protein [Ruminococcus sp.]|nr:EAL domain-containing protein [Ruminococcus sp.]